MRVYFRHRTHGLHHVPRESGAILATNHASFLDPLAAGADLPRPFFSMAKQSLHDIPLFGSFIRTFHSFPVRRGGFDRRALRKAVEIVKQGNILLMFPEGTRTLDGELRKARPGVGMIALESRCPVVPAYIHGTYEAMGKGTFFPRPVRTSIRYGKPLTFRTEADNGNRSRQYRRVAGDVMDAISKLKQETLGQQTQSS